jgi:hypothetical protein
LQEQLTAAKQAGEETAQKLKQMTERAASGGGVDASKQVRVYMCKYMYIHLYAVYLHA